MSKEKKKRVSTVVKGETKEQKFLRVVTPRVVKAVRVIRIIGNCFGSGYSYTPEQAAKILNALAGELTTLESAAQRKKSETSEFSWS